MNVLNTGRPVLCASSRNVSAARFRKAPLPARITGFFALTRMATACSTACASAEGRRVLLTGIGWALSRCFATSSGSSTTQTPGFSASASLNALRRISGIESASMIDCAHFEIGRIIAMASMFWWLSLCSRRVGP